ncbi:hypothetical protein D9758_018092 [Tetrapyrgos nigripes]|uniref:Uncharacterized protein n=1 Tax=Tetrapyrgos nigripes TaxID=182062 RepID=A0A8H5BYA3_9AGAR|nr:hypothetical protein D9758_018092 [Tetrapyrgos nigripes]
MGLQQSDLCLQSSLNFLYLQSDMANSLKMGKWCLAPTQQTLKALVELHRCNVNRPIGQRRLFVRGLSLFMDPEAPHNSTIRIPTCHASDALRCQDSSLYQSASERLLLVSFMAFLWAKNVPQEFQEQPGYAIMDDDGDKDAVSAAKLLDGLQLISDSDMTVAADGDRFT